MWKKIIGAIIIIVFLFFQITTLLKPNLTVDPAQDFITITSPPAEIESILKQACYDCHSNEPRYRWYNYVAGVGNWIDGHIEEGSHHLNFSEWGTYDTKRKKHKIKELSEEVEEKNMPLNSYTWTHSDAKLDDQQRQMLIDYFNQLAL